MDLSVVVPTLNGREQLGTCLDALSSVAPDAEVIVVNGPSADGTTGMVRDRGDVDVLVEVADRRLNAARNAGIDHATGDTVAFVSRNLTVEKEWLAAIATGLADGAAVTGPTRAAAVTARGEGPERTSYGGREVVRINPYNLAVRRSLLDELDGFDEYLQVGDGVDFAHRLAAREERVAWEAEMATRPTVGTDGGVETPGAHWRARARAYTTCKNYGPSPRLLAGLVGGTVRGGLATALGLLRGHERFSRLPGGGRDVLTGLVRGSLDGLAARRRDVAPRRNPNGRSMRTDRAVSVYDLR